MKITLFKYKSKYGFEALTLREKHLSEEDQQELKTSYLKDGTHITSEFVFIDIEVPQLSEKELVTSEVKAIDNLIDRIKSDAMDEIMELQTRKQELLAITFSSEENSGDFDEKILE